MGKQATLSTRIPRKVKAGLSALAEMTDRPIAWHVNQALSQYVELNRWQVEAIKEAMDEYRAGRAKLIPHEEVMDAIDARIIAASARPLG